MDLNEIMVFARVVEAGSFTSAARALEMPKSTVSRKVSQLEERLGARLLQRTTRKLSLTDAGRTYYHYAARMVAEVEEAERTITSLQATPRGRLRVSAPLSFGFLGPLLADFLGRYPEVQLDMVCTDRVIDLVEEGFDLAIRAGKLADSTLIARSLGGLRRIVVASPRYLKSRGTPRFPEQLATHDGIVFGAGADRARWRLEADGDSAEPTVPARMMVNDFDMLREAAIAGLGIAMLPVNVCNDDLRARRLKRVLEPWSSPETPIHAVYPSTRHISPKVSAIVEHLRACMAP